MIDVEKNRGTPTLRVDGAFGDARGVAGPGTPAKNSGDLLEPEGGMASRVRGLRRPGGAVQLKQPHLSCGRSRPAVPPMAVAKAVRRSENLCGTGYSTGRSVRK